MPNSADTQIEPMNESAVHVIVKEPVPLDILKLIAQTHQALRDSATIIRALGLDAFASIPHFTNPDVQVADPYILLTEIRDATLSLVDTLSEVDEKTVTKIQAIIANPMIKKLIGL